MTEIHVFSGEHRISESHQEEEDSGLGRSRKKVKEFLKLEDDRIMGRV